MSSQTPGEITVLLQGVSENRPGAASALMNLVYAELRGIAQGKLAGSNHELIQATALVHEAYLRLFRDEQPTWENRAHFFWAAARAMRDILVEHARREHALKRGGNHRRVGLDEADGLAVESRRMLELDEALARLSEEHPEAAQVVMLRYFAGLSREQTAAALQRSPASVWRDWNFARAWLLDRLGDDPGRTGDTPPEA